MITLFEHQADRPLADRLRPKSLQEVVGQEHLTAIDAPLMQMLEREVLPSLIFWGPPGCGKTTIARLLAAHSHAAFEQMSAIFSGVADLRTVFERAKQRRRAGAKTLLFVDEVHRFNRSQQDSFLPYLEDGTITLIGATTENPSFELNSALLSRARVMTLRRLDDAALSRLVARAEQAMGAQLVLSDEARAMLFAMADGDGRYLLGLCEQLLSIHTRGQDGAQEKPAQENPAIPLEPDDLTRLLQQRSPSYDKGHEQHYNLISALHKSLRGSDCDAALYWFARMLAGGEDPHFIARRLLRMAVEDIGMADPQAVVQAMTGWQSYERLGSPEGELALAQVVIYLATAPKSNAQYQAYKGAVRAAKNNGSLMPPMHILNAPTGMMKDLGYGAGYQYDHDQQDGFSGQNYFPEQMPREQYYRPKDLGFEREITKRLNYWQRLRTQKQG